MDKTTQKTRIAPSSKESEMMVLGCMLTNVNSLSIAADALDDSDFYYIEHKLIFQSLKMAYKEDKPADVHLVCEDLKRQDKLKAVGGPGYVTTLAQYAGTSAHIEEYAREVLDKSILRKMISAAQMIEKTALNEPSNVLSSLDEAQQLFFTISQSTNAGSGVLLQEILSGVKSLSQIPYIKELEARQERYRELGDREGELTGVPSHFSDVDKMLNGLNRSNLMILAARPAMGKTAFALNVAENVCFKSNISVGIFSLEMSAEQLVHRMVCSRSGVESSRIKTGKLDNSEFQSVVYSVGEMQKHVMVIDDKPGLKITDLRARARRMKESYNIGLLVIDYLQLLSGSGTNRTTENRQSEISEISRMLKNLARELDIPILCLSQLSRKVEERPGHRPMMNDLRESGSIEQDADIVMFLFRREYYDPNDKPGMAELIVAKNRHGGIGNINLTYRKEIVRFSDYTADRYDASGYGEAKKAFGNFMPTKN